MTQYERIERVIRYLEAHHREQPHLETLARVAGLSVFHFQRVFSRWAGATPKDFLKFLTNEHAKRLLRSSRDVLGAALEAGLSGPGRLHDLIVTVDGMTPGQYKAGGAGLEIRYGFADSPFGRCLIAWTGRGVSHFCFLDGSRDEALEALRRRYPKARLIQARQAAGSLVRRVFAAGKGRVSAAPYGTPFQLKVWEALIRLPPGRLASYDDVARAIGRPTAVRAVASAVARNDVAFLIPCHRVIRSTGVVGDYRWGRARKRAIIAWESARSERRCLRDPGGLGLAHQEGAGRDR